jgi:DeoR/GlpR family transcriptional regulator of sugar metabolism
MSIAADKRREQIVHQVVESQIVRVSDLSERFGISEVSIRRDLERLEDQGLLKRVHGGAVAVPQVSLGSSHLAKMRFHMEAKERIGRAAAQTIQEGDRLIFDSGTTVAQVAQSISGDLLNAGNLTAITASLPIVRALGSWKGVHLILLGGIFLPDYEIVVGPQTIANLEDLHADKVFLGTDGLTFSNGVTTANLLEAEVDRVMVNVSSEIIVVGDSSKIGVIGLTTILPLNRIDKLITDSQAPADFVHTLRKQGVEVVLV